MSRPFVFLLLVFFHVADDYYLQGKLALLKQKEWWAKNAPEKLYQHDYLIALVTHGFSWTFMVMLPIAIAYQLSPPRFFYLFFAMNLVIHVLIDHMKANLRKISLTTDQTLHIAQILATFFALM